MSQLQQLSMQELLAAKRRLAEQEDLTRQKTEANTALQEQVEKQQTQVQKLRHKILKLRQDKIQLQGQKDQLQQQNGQLQQQKNELEQENGELQQERDHLEQEKIQWQQEKIQLHDELELVRGQLVRAIETAAGTCGNAILQRRLQEAEERLEEYDSVLVISEEDIKMTRTRLGGGAFGEVFIAVWRGVAIAVKRFYKSLLEGNDHIISLVKQEISVCSRVHHPNVVSICGAITVGGVPLHLVMELLEASLSEVMTVSHRSGRYLSFREQIDVSIDSLCGVLYLHELHPPLLHGDIRPTNILVTATMEAKIGDLGTAHVMGCTVSYGPVSLEYVAPERKPRADNTTMHNTKEADVCSLGVTLAEIFTGQEASRKIRQKQISLVEHKLLQDVCCAMTEHSAKDRMPIAVALAQVSPLKRTEQYRSCPVKRMVKGKLYDPNGPVLVDKPWK